MLDITLIYKEMLVTNLTTSTYIRFNNECRITYVVYGKGDRASSRSLRDTTDRLLRCTIYIGLKNYLCNNGEFIIMLFTGNNDTI